MKKCHESLTHLDSRTDFPPNKQIVYVRSVKEMSLNSYLSINQDLDGTQCNCNEALPVKGWITNKTKWL